MISLLKSLSHPTRHREESNSRDCFTFRNLIYIIAQIDAIRFSLFFWWMMKAFLILSVLTIMPYNLKLVWLPKKWWDEEEEKDRARNKDGMYRIRKMLNDLWLQGYVQFYSLSKTGFFPALLIIIVIVIINIIIGEQKKGEFFAYVVIISIYWRQSAQLSIILIYNF